MAAVSGKIQLYLYRFAMLSSRLPLSFLIPLNALDEGMAYTLSRVVFWFLHPVAAKFVGRHTKRVVAL